MSFHPLRCPTAILNSLDAHAIYLLNLLLAFLQPRFDPSLQDDLAAEEMEGGGSDDGPVLPSQRDDEFRPFVRRLPEWQFWYVAPAPPRLVLLKNRHRLSVTRATAIALVCTTSEVFDVPVYWPILVVYFLTLFFLTMRRQIQYVSCLRPSNCFPPLPLLEISYSLRLARHMIKYKYVPFDLGRKARYGSK